MRTVSIIIPVKEVNDYIKESIPHILNLDYKDFEIIIFADVHAAVSFPKTTIIATGKIGPAEKRDLALKYARGSIFAFLDDDAYPRRDWLSNALRHFDNPEVAAVGGPAVTPSSDTFHQKVSGAVFLSKIGGGNPDRYWPIGGVKEVDDWPSVNLLVRRSVFERVGGFNSDYWPGEDTKLCLDIIKTGGKIIYDPDVFVWHHRREGLIRHLRQVGGYGLHRGFFAKKFPETSKKLKYFIPSFFVIFLSVGMSLFFTHNYFFSRFFYAGIGVYTIALIIALFQIQGKEKNLAVSLVSLFYISLTHIWYGIRFLQGYLFTKDLKSELKTITE
ncbi:MAG: glycosyltransferase [Deltaproteobacteria bacterium]|nr:glycosyltransferase [Deltaproteobacteria bacterium]